MASCNPTDCQPAPSHRAMLLQCLDRVGGAAWIIAASGWQVGRNHHLIRTNNRDKGLTHRRLTVPSKAGTRANALFAQLGETCVIRRRKRAHDHVGGVQRRKDVQSDNLPKPSLHSISFRRIVRKTGHDNAGPRLKQKGSDIPNLEVRGPESLPFLSYHCELRGAGQPPYSREPTAVRRRRTLTAA